MIRFFKKQKPVTQPTTNEFDVKFGFMLKNNIVDAKDYQRVKRYYLEAYPKED